MRTAHNETTARAYAGFYASTQRQVRFWGWSSRGWGNLRDAELDRPVKTLAAWLRQAHEHLDSDRCSLPDLPRRSNATFPEQNADEHEAAQQPRKNRRLQFVCNRRFIGLIIR